MKAPPTFSTGEPSYFVPASTPGSASPTIMTASNVAAGVDFVRLRFIEAQYSPNVQLSQGVAGQPPVGLPARTEAVPGRVLHRRDLDAGGRVVRPSCDQLCPRDPSIAERRRQGGGIGQGRPRRTQVSRRPHPAACRSTAASADAAPLRAPVWPRAVSPEPTEWLARYVSPARHRTRPPWHRSFPRSTGRPIRACHRRFASLRPRSATLIDERMFSRAFSTRRNAAIARTSGSLGSALMFTGMTKFCSVV